MEEQHEVPDASGCFWILIVISLLSWGLIMLFSSGCSPRPVMVDRAVAAPEFPRHIWRERLAAPESQSYIIPRK